MEGDALAVHTGIHPAGHTVAGGVGRTTRTIVLGYALALALGTALLSLPVATRSGEPARLVDAVFTATSALCVTGLVTVDTGGYWSGFGQAVILALIQLGGLGIMTFASLMMLLLFGRVALRRRLVVQAETKAPTLANIGRLVRAVVVFSLAAEAVVATVLTTWFAARYGQPLGSALYSGVFHAISAFNNAGFSLYSDSLSRYVTDPVVCLTVAAAVILGGLGYPVVFELTRAWRRPSRWSVMTRVTVILTAALLLLGTAATLLTEQHNPETLAPLTGPQKLLAGFFHSVMARTAGFNSVDTSALRPETLFATDVLMFIGGGSAGTAGGIKVTTVGVLAYIIWSEVRGEPTVIIGRRRIPESSQRQALAVALLAIGAVIVATLTLLGITGYDMDRVLFEVVSAFGTVGLSAGITADLPPAGALLLVVLMFLGRLGPLTVASALAAQERTRRYDRPHERTIVG